MKIKVFAIYDIKAKAYHNPFFLPKKAMALRDFKQAVNDPQTVFNKHPEDYALFYIGEYDTTNAKMEPLKAIENIGLGMELLENPINDIPQSLEDLDIEFKETETENKLKTVG